MGTNVSVKDIAKKLNISLSTVHKALTGKGGVSDERRKEVIDTAHSMGYKVNRVAQTLARKSINIGILMPSMWQDYFEDMKKGMEKELKRLEKYKVKGMFYLVSSDFSGDDAEKSLSWIRNNEIDALIYCPSMYCLHEEFISSINRLSIPVFIAGDSFSGVKSITDIVTDSSLSGKIAADFLKCIKGNEIKAAVFTGSLKINPHREKVEAFSKRVKSYGGSVEFVCETEDIPQKTMEYMEKIALSSVNAIYVSTATSVPVCKCIEENGLNEKFAVICTDLFDELKYYMKKDIAKATIYQNQEKVGSFAVKSAYEYFVKKNSYGNEDVKTEKIISIRPSLFLLADIE